ncbi:MAG: hypothetical protein CMM87_01720 [Rickettsiales bacterium]|nr:hypothetical protein [Rickettsiales bacterium]|tara:strand:+ start:3329 stop:3910 length:582 start_codon:yes stop_codon:yes gene_type:complete
MFCGFFSHINSILPELRQECFDSNIGQLRDTLERRGFSGIDWTYEAVRQYQRSLISTPLNKTKDKVEAFSNCLAEQIQKCQEHNQKHPHLLNSPLPSDEKIESCDPFYLVEDDEALSDFLGEAPSTKSLKQIISESIESLNSIICPVSPSSEKEKIDILNHVLNSFTDGYLLFLSSKQVFDVTLFPTNYNSKP